MHYPAATGHVCSADTACRLNRHLSLETRPGPWLQDLFLFVVSYRPPPHTPPQLTYLTQQPWSVHSIVHPMLHQHVAPTSSPRLHRKPVIRMSGQEGVGRLSAWAPSRSKHVYGTCTRACRDACVHSCVKDQRNNMKLQLHPESNARPLGLVQSPDLSTAVNRDTRRVQPCRQCRTRLLSTFPSTNSSPSICSTVQPCTSLH